MSTPASNGEDGAVITKRLAVTDRFNSISQYEPAMFCVSALVEALPSRANAAPALPFTEEIVGTPIVARGNA